MTHQDTHTHTLILTGCRAFGNVFRQPDDILQLHQLSSLIIIIFLKVLKFLITAQTNDGLLLDQRFLH